MRSGSEALAPLLDFKLLQLFDALYRTRSVSRAADMLGLAQPTASIWLQRLRRELDDALFVRGASGLEPTPRADDLVGVVRATLGMLQRLTERGGEFQPSNAVRRFRICMSDASHITLLPQMLGRLRSEGVGMRVDALPIDAATGRRLMEGEADLAIGFIPDLDAGFFQQRLYRQNFVCLVNAHHPRVGRRFTVRHYEREGHVEVASGTGYRLLNQAIAGAKLRRDVVLELPGFLGLASVLAETDLIATLPRHIGETLVTTAALRVLPCPFPIASFEVKQHWHERYHAESGNRWLRGVIAELFQKDGKDRVP